jgi:hypothetical protein
VLLLWRLWPFLVFFASLVPIKVKHGLANMIGLYHVILIIYLAFYDYVYEIIRWRRLIIYAMCMLLKLHRHFYGARVITETHVNWYSPHLLATVLFECGCDPEIFAVRSRLVLQRAIAPLELPQTLALQVSQGTMQLAELVMENLGPFRLRGPHTGRTSFST